MNKFKIALLFLIISISHFTFGQDSISEPKTIMGANREINFKKMTYFISPAIGITTMDGSTTALLNIRGGVGIGRNMSIGGYFDFSMNEIYPASETLPNVYMDYWSSGGFIEYTVLSNNLIHFTFPLIFGYGEVQMDNENGDAGLGEQNFFKVEPSALLEINFNKYFRFNLGAGYRILNQMNYRNFNQSDISGLTGYFGIKIGKFK